MRRWLGISKDKDKSQKSTPSSPAPSPSPNTSQSLHSTAKEASSSSASTDSDVRKSKHVQFHQQEEQQHSGKPIPRLASQSSLNSRNPGNVTNARPLSGHSEMSHVFPRPNASFSPDPGRTTSPLSFSTSINSGVRSPYENMSLNHSLSRLAARDPSQIYQPLTWSEMANHELVQNLSARERTRQEILWEVVASEERYVHELRSLVEYYVTPMLQRSLSPPGSPQLTEIFTGNMRSPTPTSNSIGKDGLPIAARFIRTINNVPLDTYEASIPDMESDDSHTTERGARSPVIGNENIDPNYGTITSSIRESSFSRLTAIAGFKTRPAKGSVKAAVLEPPPIPPALRNALEVIPEMLKGHEELSKRLKEQWEKAFPLVRGLAMVWSDQPWFLETYTKYIVSLEEALESIDRCLPSPHSANLPFSLRSKPKTQYDKENKKLAKFISSLEETASGAGEAGLAISLSKPLMRLGKLPLLMQSLLYHTDATTVEYEKTRAMALEVDALVRSIEDEKIEEEEREKVRDVLARIDGIKDKTLMAPRSSRILIEEVPVNPEIVPTDQAPRRAMSESAPKGTIPMLNNKKSARRLSDLVNGGKNQQKEWFVRFSDVTIRCVKVGTTEIPGGFSREKEKQGKQGKIKKKGKLRNLYKFVRVEKREVAAALAEAGGVVSSGTLEEETEDETDTFESESRMSFTFDGDDPKPIAPRNFKDDIRSKKNVNGTNGSSTTRSVVAKHTPAKQKFGSRLTGTSTNGSGRRYDSPTLASMARASSSAQGHHRVQGSTSSIGSTMDRERPMSPNTKNMSSIRRDPVKKNPKISAHSRDDSTLLLYQAFWKDDTPAGAPPVPATMPSVLSR